MATGVTVYFGPRREIIDGGSKRNSRTLKLSMFEMDSNRCAVAGRYIFIGTVEEKQEMEDR